MLFNRLWERLLVALSSSIRRVLLSFSAFALLASAAPVMAAEDEEDEEGVEEIIVTGSYIRRDNFDLPSPINVTSELDIELSGTTDLGDIVFDQTFQYGVNANATPFEGNGADDQQWNQGQEVWANLRGLGTRATMTMIDGHRLPADTNTWGRRAGVDVNATYPSNAIARIETILDGASAIYGAEAVGGVINLIPKKDFEGLELSYDAQQPFEGDGGLVTTLGLLAGVQGERGGAIFAVELRDQERMKITERPDFILSGADPWVGQVYTPWWHDYGDGGTPGTYNVPIRNAAGDLMPLGTGHAPGWPGPVRSRNFDHWIGHSATGPVNSIETVDPGCGYQFGGGHDDLGTPPAEFQTLTFQERVQNGNSTYNDLTRHANFLNGMQHAHSINTPVAWNSPRCIMSVSDFQDISAEADTNRGMAYFEYEFNEYVKLRGEIVVSSNDYNTRDSSSEFDELDTNELNGPMAAVVIGHNPGNPFRAFADGSAYDPTGSGFVGQQNGILDWVDVNGNGLYEYGTEPGEYYLFAQDADGNGIPDRDFNGDGIADPGAEFDLNAMVVLMGLDGTTDSDGDGVPDRFDQDWAFANGGLRLFEDVRPHTFRLKSFPKHARNNTLPWAFNDDGILGYERRFQRDNMRLRLGGEFSIPDTDWIIDVDYIWTTGTRETTYPEPVLPQFIDALRCQGGSDTSGQATGGFSFGGAGSCWNPFSTTWLNTTPDGQLVGTAPTHRGGYPSDDEYLQFPDRDDPGWRPFYEDTNGDGIIDPRTDQISPEVNTELENRQAGVVLQYNLQELGMQIVDTVASTGNLFTIPWNDQPVGFALGFHYRVETEEWRPSSINQTNLGGGRRGLRESEQETNAIFAEFNLPLLEHDRWGTAELQVAARYAEVKTKGIVGIVGSSKFDTTIPKVALRYQPTDWLAFRGSMTEGFVTPGLYALFGTAGQFSGPGTNGGGRGTVGDYICDGLPELGDCDGASRGGGVPNVFRGSAPNQDLGAEESDLWNAGLTFRLLDGDLVFDMDYTEVEFKGRVEQIGATINVRTNELGFEEYVTSSCPGTIFDWDNTENENVTEEIANQSIDEYIASTPQAELDCRRDAAVNWVLNDANDGQGETSIGGSALVRGGGPNGLGLTLVDEPWVEQGSQKTRTMIYALRYAFDADQLPLIGGDYGSFQVNMSVTQMLEQSIQRFKSFGCSADLLDDVGRCPGDHPFAGIEIDGVGFRNADNYGFNGPGDELYAPLAPSPEFRANIGLRWFMGNHTAQILGNWHDSIENYNHAWDELRERGALSEADALIPEEERCQGQPSCVGDFDDEMYWNLSYTYYRPDFFGANLSVNVAVRNIFNNFPTPKVMPAGFEGYLDNIMGRVGYVRLTLGI